MLPAREPCEKPETYPPFFPNAARPMDLQALFLNCTLKRSPATSNTRALIDKVAALFEAEGVSSEVVRVVDHDVRFGVSSDEGEGDAWPQILGKVTACDILVVGTPIWFGVRGSVAQMVMERLDGTYDERDERGQYPLYNTVGACVVTGNEDGAHDAAATTLFNLSHLGCTIPPGADCYWVGDAGPGPSYLAAGGDRHLYTNRTARYLAKNCAEAARWLKAHPYSIDLDAVDAAAKEVSR